ncbi:Putative small multi-drug export protein [Clostridiales bacterium CHKCI001]|nr:Putative small multi-drug export protein [Clostridiales bacterium CHKCI001]
MFGKYIFVFFISMVPLIKPRGALPYSQTFRLPLVSSYIIAIIGNMLPVPIIYLFAHKVLEWGKDKPYIGKFSHSVLKKGKRADRS